MYQVLIKKNYTCIHIIHIICYNNIMYNLHNLYRKVVPETKPSLDQQNIDNE